MSLLEYLRILIQRGWIILLCGVLFAGAMYLYSARQTVIYQSTQVVLLQPARANQGVGAAHRSLLNSYVVYLNSSYIAQEIADSLEMGISGTELKGRTEISAIPDRLTIEIRVNDTDGDNANRVAFAWGEKLIQLRQEQNANLPAESHINAILQDFPTYVQYRPRILVNMALGGIVGLLLGGVIVFILEFRHHRVVRYRDDLEFITGQQPLVSIPVETH